MKGLRVIPAFLFLILLAYLGLLFVEANRDEVVINFGSFHSPQTPIGFVVLTSALIGMVGSGLLCSIELLALHLQNRKLMRKVSALDRRRRAVEEGERAAPLAGAASSEMPE